MSSVKCGVSAFALAVMGFSCAVAQSGKTTFLQPHTIGATTRVQERWADRTLKRLTLEEKIGQMIEVRGIMGFDNSEDPTFDSDLRKLARELKTTIAFDAVAGTDYAIAVDGTATGSLRLIVNRTALKTQPETIGAWIARLRAALEPA